MEIITMSRRVDEETLAMKANMASTDVPRSIDGIDGRSESVNIAIDDLLSVRQSRSLMKASMKLKTIPIVGVGRRLENDSSEIDTAKHIMATAGLPL
jgi:hypothetical protein